MLRDIVEEKLQRRWYRRAAAMVPTTNAEASRGVVGFEGERSGGLT